MKRRVLPILSVVCLALAGVLTLEYIVEDCFYRLSKVDGGYVTWTVCVQSGAVSVGRTSIRPGEHFMVSGTEGWQRYTQFHARPLRTIYQSLYYFDAERSGPYVNGNDVTIAEQISFPLWLVILPLLIPYWLLWRRRRRRKHANVPGFPVEAAPPGSGSV